MMDLKGLKFTKMHGIGNDFPLIDEYNETLIPEEEKNTVCRFICHRNFSIGGDGVLFVTPSTNADIGYRMFNPDGSEAEMCGNGIRCFAKYVTENKLITKDKFTVETRSGIKTITIKKDNGNTLYSVDMGTSTFQTSEIPMTTRVDEFIDMELSILDEKMNLTAISVGNPHAILFTTELESLDLDKYGPAIECHNVFPEKINVHFIERLSSSEANMRTWERGAGITLACGTGATATAITGYKLGLFDKNILLHLPGGDLRFEIYEKDGQLGAIMEGQATTAFTGTLQ